MQKTSGYFLLRAKRVTKQSSPPPHRSQRYVSLTQAVNYRLFFYYEAQRVTKQSLPSPHRSQRYVSLTQAVNYRLFFYYEAKRVTNWFIQILFGARCGCIDSAARLFWFILTSLPIYCTKLPAFLHSFSLYLEADTILYQQGKGVFFGC